MLFTAGPQKGLRIPESTRKYAAFPISGKSNTYLMLDITNMYDKNKLQFLHYLFINKVQFSMSFKVFLSFILHWYKRKMIIFYAPILAVYLQRKIAQRYIIENSISTLLLLLGTFIYFFFILQYCSSWNHKSINYLNRKL